MDCLYTPNIRATAYWLEGEGELKTAVVLAWRIFPDSDPRRPIPVTAIGSHFWKRDCAAVLLEDELIPGTNDPNERLCSWVTPNGHMDRNKGKMFDHIQAVYRPIAEEIRAKNAEDQRVKALKLDYQNAVREAQEAEARAQALKQNAKFAKSMEKIPLGEEEKKVLGCEYGKPSWVAGKAQEKSA